MKNLSILAACVVLFLLASSSVEAQGTNLGAPVVTVAEEEPTEGTDDGLGEARELGGHVFIQSAAIPFPFVSSYVRTATGFGMFSADVDPAQVAASGGLLPDTLNIAQVDFSIGGGIGIADRVGLLLDVTGLVGVGIDEESALAAGALFFGNAGAGAVVKIFETETFYLSGQLHGSLGFGELVSPLVFAAQALDTGMINADTLLQDSLQWSVAPVAMFALAPHEVVGIQGGLGLDVSGESPEDGASDTSVGLPVAVGVSVDGATLFAPIALLAVYGIAIPFEDADPAHTVEGGLYYSGYRHLNLGLAVVTQLGNGQSYTQGQFRLAHYW